MSNTKVMIEFNETSKDVKSFKNQELTIDLLSKVMAIDCEWHLKDKGYLKFYFDIYKNNKKIKHLRIDVGDGLDQNADTYKYLTTYIKR